MENVEGGIKRKSRLAVFEHVVEKEKKPKHKRFRPNRLDLDDSSPSESELVIDDDATEPVKKKRNPLIRLSEEPLNLICEWDSCKESFESWESFNNHLRAHALETADTLKCRWTNCKSEILTSSLHVQHLSYHGYLTKLKNIGQNVLCRNALPKCTQREENVNPVRPNGYTCEWEDCSNNFLTVFEFYTHMELHIKNNPRVSNEALNETIVCAWDGCNTKYSSQYKLAEHVRTHTKERIVACPTCCTLFSNKTKFNDHRKRQLATNLQSYQCSQCLKLFPSERLLRDHMRAHINHYKCNMCDMTCPKPSILAKHIRFKHVKFKPYKCTHCPKAFIDKQNLDTHLKTHSSVKSMKCEQCDFRCRTKIGLDNHYIRAHARLSSWYECHCCKLKYKRGGYLTRHLMKVHNYHWPSGHSRFRYRKDHDNIYRLQTVRYESLEVTQEMIRSESMQSNNVVQDASYKLRYDNDGQSDYILSVSETGEQSVKSTAPKQSNILITIDDVDEHGNILKSEVVEANELVGHAIKADIVIAEQGLPDLNGETVLINSKKIVDSQGEISKSNIEIKDHVLPSLSDTCEEKPPRRSLRKRKSRKNQGKEEQRDGIKSEVVDTEDVRHFSIETISNDLIKIETPRVGL